MSNESICVFIPSNSYKNKVTPINFVYETEFKTLHQPHFPSIFRLHLVTKGHGTLKTKLNKFDLTVGSIYFAFPSFIYEIDGSDDFEYMYISFTGEGMPGFLNNLSINQYNPAFNGFEHIIPFWMDSIKKVNDYNSNILTESVLLYTLSFFEFPQKTLKNHPEPFEAIIDYIDNHYRDKDLTLKKIANIFSYTEKHLSFLFQKNMSINFRQYINSLRMQYALEIISNSNLSIKEIASECGFGDAMYFSKVFKKSQNITPQNYKKSKSRQNH